MMQGPFTDTATAPGEDRPVGIPRGRPSADLTATEDPGSLASAPTLASDGGSPLEVVLPPRIGRYLIIERIGAGGMGVVAAAYDPELDRRVAIKLLRATPRADAGARLLREAQALARLSHPNVVQIHDAGAFDGRIFLAMELVEGTDLRAWLTVGGRPWRSILRVFVDAGRGLAAAHAVGIVHRDFKPENVLIGGDGRVRVADFGLARQASDDAAVGPGGPPRTSALEVSLTQSGALLGTPAYMPPEQFAGGVADARGDLFSFCVALYEALYGVRPYRGDTLAELLATIDAGRLTEPPALPATAAIPRRVAMILRRGLARDPAARYPSMEALLAELTFDPGARRRRWGLAAGLALAASALTYGLTPAVAPVAATAPPCAGGEAALAGLWGPERAAALTPSLARALPTAAAQGQVLRGVEAYAAAWVAGRRDACLAHHRGDESAALRDARMRCLDRRRDALDGALRLLGDARPGDDLPRVVAGLPAIAACARIDALAAEPGRDPKAQEALERGIRGLDRGQVLADAGRLEDAAAAIAAIVEEAAVAGPPALKAHAHLAVGRLEMTRGGWREAEAALREALAAAVVAGEDGLAAEASARLFHARVRLDPEAPAVLLEEAPLAQAFVDRLGGDGFAQRRLWANLAYVAMVAGDRKRAREELARATAGLAAVVDAPPLEVASILRLAAALSDEPAARSAAFDRAEAELRRLLGDDHPELLNLRLYRGRGSLDLAEAEAEIAGACAGYRRIFPEPDPEFDPSCAECGLLLGGIAEARGDRAGARARFEAAATCDQGRPETAAQAEKLASRSALALAHAELLGGREAAALEAVAVVEEALAPHATPERWWIQNWLAEASAVAGQAHLRRGALPEAVAALERAHRIYSDLEATVQVNAHPRFLRAQVAAALAEALWRAEPTAESRLRARELAAEARDFHRGRPGGAEAAAALEEWLGAHSAQGASVGSPALESGG